MGGGGGWGWYPLFAHAQIFRIIILQYSFPDFVKTTWSVATGIMSTPVVARKLLSALLSSSCSILMRNAEHLRYCRLVCSSPVHSVKYLTHNVAMV